MHDLPAAPSLSVYLVGKGLRPLGRDWVGVRVGWVSLCSSISRSISVAPREDGEEYLKFVLTSFLQRRDLNAGVILVRCTL